LLDEPTNHLDMHSVELLADALMKYEGTYIFVSHDRYFISKAANKIWEIVDHEIKEFAGGYEEWAAWKERNQKSGAGSSKSGSASQKTEEKKVIPATKEKPVVRPVIEIKATGQPINKEAKKELQKQQRIFQQLEEKIAAANSRQSVLQESLQLPEVYADRNKFHQAETDLKNLTLELSTLNKQYEEVFEKIMHLESGMNQA
jgi:ATP-binding cassette subfamily F protein 3